MSTTRLSLLPNPHPKSEPVLANAQGFSDMPAPAVWDKAELLGSLRLVVGEFTATISCCFMLRLVPPAHV